jgi:hypothetical protein
VATTAPSATSRGTDSIDLFVRGSDGQVYLTTGTAVGWSAWSSLGGATVSAPVAVASSANRIDVWARGSSGALQHKFWQPATGWSGWSETFFAGSRR